MLPTDIMSSQLLSIYSDLVNGKVLTKAELVQRFHVTERSIQRDVESLHLFIAEQMAAQDIVYDRKRKGYRLTNTVQTGLTNSEILAVCKAVCKILLESRSMMKEEMYPILDDFINIYCINWIFLVEMYIVGNFTQRNNDIIRVFSPSNKMRCNRSFYRCLKNLLKTVASDLSNSPRCTQ